MTSRAMTWTRDVNMRQAHVASHRHCLVIDLTLHHLFRLVCRIDQFLQYRKIVGFLMSLKNLNFA